MTEENVQGGEILGNEDLTLKETRVEPQRGEATSLIFLTSSKEFSSEKVDLCSIRELN